MDQITGFPHDGPGSGFFPGPVFDMQKNANGNCDTAENVIQWYKYH